MKYKFTCFKPSKINYFLLISWVSIFIISCSGQTLTAEDEIRQFIDFAIAAAEKRNAGALIDQVDEHYSDPKGLDKRQLEQMLRFYFLRNKNIHLFKKIEKISLSSRQQASVTLYVAMAGRAIRSTSVLASLRAKIYRIQMELVKPDEVWLLQSASWQAASPGEMVD